MHTDPGTFSKVIINFCTVTPILTLVLIVIENCVTIAEDWTQVPAFLASFISMISKTSPGKTAVFFTLVPQGKLWLTIWVLGGALISGQKSDMEDVNGDLVVKCTQMQVKYWTKWWYCSRTVTRCRVMILEFGK